MPFRLLWCRETIQLISSHLAVICEWLRRNIKMPNELSKDVQLTAGRLQIRLASRFHLQSFHHLWAVPHLPPSQICDEVGSGRYSHKTVSQSDKGNKDNKSIYAAFFLPLPLGLSCTSIIAAYSGSWVLCRYNINFSEDLNSHVAQTLISTKRLNNSVWRSRCKHRLTASAIWELVNSW